MAALRAEGTRVLLHCVQAQSHTLTVPAVYAAGHLGVAFDQELEAVRGVLPVAAPQRALIDAARRAAAAR